MVHLIYVQMQNQWKVTCILSRAASETGCVVPDEIKSVV